MDGRSLAARFREVEVEVTGQGGEALLDDVVAALVIAGALPGDERPKVVRALGRRATEPPDVAIVDLPAHATVREVVAGAIAAGYCRLTEHDPGVRLDEDIEDVHQARVATRRLRSDLRTFAGVVDNDWAVPVREELGWMAEALGRVRDADVLGLRLAEQVALLEPADRAAALPLRKRLEMQRRGAFRDLLTAMDSDRYLRLLDTLASGAADPPLAQPPAPVFAGQARSPEDAAPAEEPLAGAGLDLAEALGMGDAAAEGGHELVAVAGDEDDLLAPTGGAGWSVAARAPWPSAAAFSGSIPAPLNGGVAADGGASGPVGAPFRLAAPITALEVSMAIVPDVVPPPPESEAGSPQDAAAGTGEATETGGATETGESGAAGAGDNGPASAALWAGVDPDALASDALPRLVRKPWRRVVRAISELDAHPPDEALHEIRIRAKRLRYACEAVAVVVGKPATRLAKDAAALQGVLGDQHDAVVAEEWLREASRTAKGPAAIVAGQLIATERAAQAAGRSEWRAPAQRVISDEHRVWLNRKTPRR
jgi:CHAD domain-containing protein